MLRRWLIAFCCAFAAVALMAGCSGKPEKAEAASTGGGEKSSAVKPIVIGCDAAFPPMEFVDEKGEIIGFDVDLMKAVSAKLNRPVKFQSVAWDGIFGMLSNGSIDMIVSSVTITEERRANYAFSAPYYTAGQVLVVRTEDAAKYATLDALKGKKVGAQAGTTGFFALEERKDDFAGISSYPVVPLAMIDLVNGSIEAVLTDKPVADYYSSRDDRVAGKLKVVGELVTSEEFGIVLRPEQKDLLAEVDRALDAVRKSGEYDEIYQRWFGGEAAAKP